MNKIEYIVETTSNCLIGNQTERFSIGGVDQSTTVDERGLPIIYGSSFKGAVRNMVRENEDQMGNTQELMRVILNEIKNNYENLDEKIKRNDAIQKVIKKIEDLFKSPIKPEYIFGIEGLNDMPRLFFSDLRLAESKKRSEYFAIDTKNTLEEKNGELLSNPRTYKVLRPGIKFNGYILFHGFDRCVTDEKSKQFVERVKKESMKELKKVLEFFNDGAYGLGNSKSRGYGQIQISFTEMGENK